MTPEEFAEKMKKLLSENGEHETETHMSADDLMCDVLQLLGYGEGVEFYKRMTRWYE